MKNLVRPALGFAVALVLVGLGAHARADLVGHWSGYGINAGIQPPGPPIRPALEIIAQHGTHFTGALRLDLDFPPSPCDGTVDAAGMLRATGMDAFGNMLVVTGRIRDLAVPPPDPDLPPGPCFAAALRYQFSGPLMRKAGTMLLLQDMANRPPGPPQIGGPWLGEYFSRRSTTASPVLFDLAQGTDPGTGALLTSFDGAATFVGVPLPPDPRHPSGWSFECGFETHGTVSVPAVQADGSEWSRFAFIGVEQPPGPPTAPANLVAIFVGTRVKQGPPIDPDVQPGPPTIDGSYALYANFSTAFLSVYNGTAATFDDGSLSLTGG